jgi:hypothetical protein
MLYKFAKKVLGKVTFFVHVTSNGQALGLKKHPSGGVSFKKIIIKIR